MRKTQRRRVVFAVVTSFYFSTALAAMAFAAGPGSGNTAITAVWANDGEDKVTQDELRASDGQNVTNSLWNGSTISLFGAKNEVVDFNLILEAASTSATNVSVTMSDLSGPNGSVIRYAPRSTNNLFNWTTTESELFYIRYLQILGLSNDFYGTLATWQEPTFPIRAQCPSGTGCAFTLRPVANRFYPDIAVPIELVPTFTISAGTNQSVWADIYIPKTVAPGAYTGTVTISQSGIATSTVPISLEVMNFALPDAPTSLTMMFTEYGDLYSRYGAATLQAMQNQMLVAHRHKISIIDDNMGVGSGWTGPGWNTDAPAPQWIPFLNGTGFTATNGYAGPGAGTGNNVFSIGTYGGMTGGLTQSVFTADFNGWETWFEASSPSTDRFVYLCDEVYCQSMTPTLMTQLGWWSAITGPGRNLPTMATQTLLGAPNALSDPTSLWPYSQGYLKDNNWVSGYRETDQKAVNAVLADEPTRELFAYASTRPGEGSFAIEDDGTSLRELPWAQYKKQVNRWFIWESTYYDNTGNGVGNTDVFATAQTWGAAPSYNTMYGEISDNSDNGNGVAFYPGTDAVFPTNSYGISGPIASLRLKYWRRGIQDVDYLALANAIAPGAVASLVQQMVPLALWENQCYNPANDCTYNFEPISWSNDPDAWEAARLQLANIIDGQPLTKK
jgi:hypothetical protein